MKTNQSKLKKSASACHFTIDFNPNEMKCGSSKINRLPDKRAQSSKGVEKPKSKERVPEDKGVKDSQLYEINILKRINESLERENQVLKKQLQYYTQNTSSRRSSIVVKNEETYKDKILNRINGSRVSTKNDTESTGFGSSKMTTARGMEDNISQLFDKYSLKAIKPSLETIYEVAKSYFCEFKENYVKLKSMFNSVKTNENLFLNQKIEELLKLFEVPILFKDQPSLLAKSLSKQNFKKSKSKRIETDANWKGEFEPEMTSPLETLSIFEKMIKVISTSPKLLERVGASKVYRNFEKKVRNI